MQCYVILDKTMIKFYCEKIQIIIYKVSYQTSKDIVIYNENEINKYYCAHQNCIFFFFLIYVTIPHFSQQFKYD